jgi:hypothetical protein
MDRQMRVAITAAAVCALVTALAHASDSVDHRGQTPQTRTTVIGCLKRADAASTAAAGATTGTTGTETSNPQTAKASGYILTNASITSSPATWPRGGVSGNGSPATGVVPRQSGRGAEPAATPSVYVLEGSSDALQPHVDQQVEIKGQIDMPASAPATRATPSARAGSSGRAVPSPTESGHATQRLRVESVRVLADACSVQ